MNISCPYCLNELGEIKEDTKITCSKCSALVVIKLLPLIDHCDFAEISVEKPGNEKLKANIYAP